MTTLPWTELKIATVSDIHLGHRRNKAAEIIQNLNLAFPDNAETADLDILFLAGDVFDSLLQLPHEDVALIKYWVTSLLRLCKKHDIVLRVLEGTPRHDWEQSKMFEVMNTASRIGCDIEHPRTISIEYMERFGIHVLYVPDEANDTSEKTLDQVKALMKARGLTQVDLAIMHGQFEYQLPPHIPAQKHDSSAYLPLVRHLIFIGHVHTYSRLEKIVAQGSFDRLTHGQEEAKGHVRAILRPSGEDEVVFVENITAKQFITVPCLGLDLNQTLERIGARLVNAPEGAYVRLEIDAGNPIQSNREVLIRRYPLLTFTDDLVRTQDKEEELTFSEEGTAYQPITITRDNVTDLLMDRLSQIGTSAAIMAISRTLLAEVL